MPARRTFRPVVLCNLPLLLAAGRGQRCEALEYPWRYLQCTMVTSVLHLSSHHGSRSHPCSTILCHVPRSETSSTLLDGRWLQPPHLPVQSAQPLPGFALNVLVMDPSLPFLTQRAMEETESERSGHVLGSPPVAPSGPSSQASPEHPAPLRACLSLLMCSHTLLGLLEHHGQGLPHSAVPRLGSTYV